jgi:hypothetical protein
LVNEFGWVYAQPVRHIWQGLLRLWFIGGEFDLLSIQAGV